MKAFIKTGKKYLGMIVPALEAAEALIADGKDEEAMLVLTSDSSSESRALQLH